MANKNKLITDVELIAVLGTGFSKRTITHLRHTGRIPFIKIGHRTVRYEPDKVLAALKRREVKAK